MKIVKPDGQIIYEGTLEENKEEAFFAISQKFEEMARTNKFTTTQKNALTNEDETFEVDNRWVGKSDIDNAQIALDTWYSDSLPYIIYRDAHKQNHFINKTTLISLINEAKLDRLKKFSSKWKRENAVENSTTNEQIWNFVEAPDSDFPPDI